MTLEEKVEIGINVGLVACEYITQNPALGERFSQIKQNLIKTLNNQIAFAKQYPAYQKVLAPIANVFKKVGKTFTGAGSGIKKFFKKGNSVGLVGKEVGKKTGTVWDSIKATDPMYKNTRIPKSFELTAGNKKLWVHPNATEHMYDYLKTRVSHQAPINSQTMLSGLKASVEQAIKQGF